VKENTRTGMKRGAAEERVTARATCFNLQAEVPISSSTTTKTRKYAIRDTT